MHTHLHANQLNKGFNAFVETMNCGRVMRRKGHMFHYCCYFYIYRSISTVWCVLFIWEKTGQDGIVKILASHLLVKIQ